MFLCVSAESGRSASSEGVDKKRGKKGGRGEKGGVVDGKTGGKKGGRDEGTEGVDTTTA